MSNALLTGIRGVIFDYGGTLDTRGDHWSHILRQGWEHCGIKADEQQFRHAYVYAERALAAHRIMLQRRAITRRPQRIKRIQSRS